MFKPSQPKGQLIERKKIICSRWVPTIICESNENFMDHPKFALAWLPRIKYNYAWKFSRIPSSIIYWTPVKLGFHHVTSRQEQKNSEKSHSSSKIYLWKFMDLVSTSIMLRNWLKIMRKFFYFICRLRRYNFYRNFTVWFNKTGKLYQHFNLNPALSSFQIQMK